VHGNAWRAGFGSLSRLFDLATFDRMRRRSSPACRRMPDPLPFCVPSRPFPLLRPRLDHPPHIRWQLEPPMYFGSPSNVARIVHVERFVSTDFFAAFAIM
jgi:hypothetical protein